ncbi:MAG: DUF4249 domain-containing protein [Ginsengibacter sp.]
MSIRKLNRSFIFLFAGVLSLTNLSCEKVIEINLNKTNPKYVIEGNIGDVQGDCKVLITQTVNFSEPSQFPRIEKAIVFIKENQKDPVRLTQTSPGVYESSKIWTKPLNTYTLLVKIDDQEFTSTVKVPQKVPFDSLYIEEFTGFGDTRRFANVIFKDPEGLGNSYRFIQYKNSLPNSNIFILNDEYSDGRTINTFLAYFDKSDNQRLDSGDAVMVEMQGIDPSVYTFFLSLSQSSTGGNESVAPGNPVTNIQGGALGYFNAYVKQQRTIVVP